jgi:hypothetical protein
MAEASVDAATKQRELYDQGNKLYDAKKWPEAEAVYLAAWKVKKSYDLAGNLGDVEMTNGKARNAAEHLAYALREFPAGGKPALREMLIKRFGDAQKLVGTLHIQVNKAGAEVFVDDRSIGYSPLDQMVFVEPGDRRIEARLEGYLAAAQSLTIAKGASKDVQLALLPASGGASTAILVTGGAATGLALGAGVILTVLSAGKAGEADTTLATLKQSGDPNPCQTRPTDCNSIDSARHARDALANGAMVSFIGAGALAAGTATYWLLASRSGAPSPSSGFRVIPTVASGQGGVVITGVW